VDRSEENEERPGGDGDEPGENQRFLTPEPKTVWKKRNKNLKWRTQDRRLSACWVKNEKQTSGKKNPPAHKNENQADALWLLTGKRETSAHFGEQTKNRPTTVQPTGRGREHEIRKQIEPGDAWLRMKPRPAADEKRGRPKQENTKSCGGTSLKKRGKTTRSSTKTKRENQYHITRSKYDFIIELSTDFLQNKVTFLSSLFYY
jgi:hypothetical protein